MNSIVISAIGVIGGLGIVALIYVLLQQFRARFEEMLFNRFKAIQDSLQLSSGDSREQLAIALRQHAELLNQQVGQLTDITRKQLGDISLQVEKRLSQGFDTTNATFTKVIERLALIDQAQKKITELSSNVVNLQELLSDKRARGAFGEIQLATLIRNAMPESSFALQYTLSNNKRVDCLLFLPKPTGNLAIDAKFPLENYQRAENPHLSENERVQFRQLFRQDIKRHINDIKEKYIIPEETSDGAIMFIPAEAVFAQIHGHYPELVEQAHRAHVWMVSPTTMMAVLTTARAVLKDAATRKQVHLIQQHLINLAEDFKRFQQRMDKLAQHINQAQEDVSLVHKSSHKITRHFQRIEQVDLGEEQVVVINSESN